MTFLEGQIACSQGWIAYWQTRILSGAYKFGTTEKMDGPPDKRTWTRLSDDELLQHDLTILKSHVDHLRDLTEALPSPSKEVGS